MIEPRIAATLLAPNASLARNQPQSGGRKSTAGWSDFDHRVVKN
jgi:hypothetical protein